MRVHHFAHKPPTNCSWAAGETAAHMEAKTHLRDSFRAMGLRSEYEVVVLSSEGDRRADVVVWLTDTQQRIAFEIQHQPLSFQAIEQRTDSYHAAQIPILWIGLIKKTTLEGAQAEQDYLLVKRYSPRPWEKWAHAYAFRKLWFLDEDGGVWLGELNPHVIDVPSSTYIDENGDENYAGGFTRKSKRYRDLKLRGPFSLPALHIEITTRRPFKTREFSLPGGRIVSLEPAL